MPPLISIIIPVYNHAHTLERCFDSIFKQTYRPLELIIVDDGSNDNFEEVISRLTPPYEGGGEGVVCKVIRQQNSGASAARNRGFKEAQGEYVIFWDADTVARPEMLERFKRQLDEHPEASYAYSQFKFGWKTMRSQRFKIEDLRLYNYIDTTSLIRRKDSVPFDESLKRFQDWDLWLTMLRQNKTGIFVPEVLFRKIVSGRKGISSWLPSFFYKLPWKNRQVKEYETARTIVLRKHLK